LHYLIPLAYDRIQDGGGHGSKKRCDVLIKTAVKVLEATKHQETIQFLSFAGYSKENKKGPNRESTLSAQMLNYVRDEIRDVIYYYGDCHNPAWGTYEEVLNTLKLIAPDSRVFRKLVVCFSTNLGHSPRVWMCIWFLRKKLKIHPDCQIKVLIADHSFTFKEYFQETIKFFSYLYKFLFNRW